MPEKTTVTSVTHYHCDNCGNELHRTSIKPQTIAVGYLYICETCVAMVEMETCYPIKKVEESEKGQK